MDKIGDSLTAIFYIALPIIVVLVVIYLVGLKGGD